MNTWCKNQPLSGEQKQAELEQQMPRRQSPRLTPHPSSQKNKKPQKPQRKRVGRERSRAALRKLCSLNLSVSAGDKKRAKLAGKQPKACPNAMSCLFPWCCLHCRTQAGTGRSPLRPSLLILFFCLFVCLFTFQCTLSSTPAAPWSCLDPKSILYLTPMICIIGFLAPRGLKEKSGNRPRLHLSNTLNSALQQSLRIESQNRTIVE